MTTDNLTPNTDAPTTHEADTPWQWLALANHVLYEILDAMQHEESPMMIQHHWQLFLYYLQQQKPDLNAQLNQLFQHMPSQPQEVSA